jgi:hypothetical protein
MKLHLGVIDFPYSEEASVTTGDVAEILEKEYGVMQHFASLHEPEIAEVLEVSAHEAIESILLGAPVIPNPFDSAMSDLQRMFNTYLDDEEIAQTGQSGVPTQAALDGVRSALKKRKEIKSPKKYRSATRGTRRPSFIDTGTYRASFKAWVE